MEKQKSPTEMKKELAELDKKIAEAKKEIRDLERNPKQKLFDPSVTVKERLEFTGDLKDTGIKSICTSSDKRGTIFTMQTEYTVYSYDADDGIPTRYMVFDNNNMPFIFGVKDHLESIGKNKWAMVRDIKGTIFNLCEMKTTDVVPVKPLPKAVPNVD